MFLKLSTSTWKRGSGILSPFLGFENAGGDVFTVVWLASFYFFAFVPGFSGFYGFFVSSMFGFCVPFWFLAPVALAV